jgi:DNA repair exonuclease SbcCD ATPase subunit
MLLKKIKLENFKKFKALDREFGYGVNVVKGVFNEMGKSTLLESIIVALFENPKSAKKELDGYTAWGSDRRCHTAIEFEAGTEKYLLEKDFEKKSLRLIEINSGKEWDTPKEVSEKLRGLLGADSSDLFLSTACIRQDDVRNIETGRKEIGQSIEGIVTGGGAEQVGASEIIAKISRQISAFSKGMEKLTSSPGPLADLKQQIAKLQGELPPVKAEVDRVEAEKLALVKTSGDLSRLEKELADSEALLERNKRRQEIEKKLIELDIQYKKIDGLIRDIESLQQQIDGAGVELRSMAGFDDARQVTEIKNALASLETSRREIEGDLPQVKKVLEADEDYLKKHNFRVILSSMPALAAGAIVAVAGFLGMALNVPSLAAGIAGLVFLVGALWVRTTLTQRRTQIAGNKDRIKQMESALVESGNQERALLSRINCSSVQEFNQKEARYNESVALRSSRENQLVGKLGAQKLDQLQQDRLTAIQNMAVEQQKNSADLQITKLSPQEYIELDGKVKHLGSEKKRLETNRLRSEISLANARFNPEDQAKMEEKLDNLKSEFEHKQKRLRVYQLAGEILLQAKNETLASAEGILQAQIQKNFAIFTNGKYQKVKVDQGTMDFHIFSDEKGDWVKPEELSGGTSDEFYLACRLALVDLIYGNARPPLILDDPFTNFDQVRLSRTLDFFKSLSREYQIIIFAISDAYDKIADKIIELN